MIEVMLSQLAVQLDGILVGGDADSPVTGVAGLDTAGEGDVTYIQNERYLPEAEASPAIAIIVPAHITHSTKPLIQVQEPKLAFIKVLRMFDWRRPPIAGIDLSAQIARSAAIHGRAYIGPHVTIGEFAVVGDGCVIHANTVVGDHVEIGPDTVLHPNVTVYPRCTIGSRVIIHAGAVIGADGLGFQPTPHGWEKMPHLGTVVIEDDVEIGALTAIDRASTGKTVIGRGTKVDNLVQIAHNVTIGPHAMVVAQVGIAGSAVIGSGVVLAGQSGVADHKTVGPGAVVAAHAGVTKDIPAGMTVSGYPAQPHAEALRQQATLRRLPELLERVKRLEQQLAAMQQQSTPADMV